MLKQVFQISIKQITILYLFATIIISNSNTQEADLSIAINHLDSADLGYRRAASNTIIDRIVEKYNLSPAVLNELLLPETIITLSFQNKLSGEMFSITFGGNGLITSNSNFEIDFVIAFENVQRSDVDPSRFVIPLEKKFTGFELTAITYLKNGCELNMIPLPNGPISELSNCITNG